MIVLPGLLGGDGSTAFLRASLEAAGFAVQGWGEGFNLRATPETLAGVEDRLLSLQGKRGQEVILIGWSLGGIYARLLAHRRPRSVALVMTLGSPFSGDRHANNAWRLYERLNDHSVDAPPFEEDVSAKPPVRTIAMWSPIDGIVAPECARGRPDQSDRQVELPYRHVELGASRRAIREVLDVLREETR